MDKKSLRTLWLLIILAMIPSVIMLLNSAGVLDFQARHFFSAQNYALTLVDYNLDLAQDLGVPEDDTRIQLTYRRLKDAIESASSYDELYHLILVEMVRFEQIVREQADYHLTNWLAWVVNQDDNFKSIESPVEIKVNFLPDQQVDIQGGDFLKEATLEAISAYSIPGALSLQTVVIVAEPSESGVQTRVKEPEMESDPIQHLQSQFKFLEQELDNLNAIAGFDELKGPGVILRLMDAEDHLITSSGLEIVHDTDIQEIVHYLNSSGALGVSVGGRRIIATSSIRCVGPTILVNYEPIPVKPFVIMAVGDADEILSTLEPLLEFYVDVRQLRVEYEVVEEVRLPAFRGRR